MNRTGWAIVAVVLLCVAGFVQAQIQRIPPSRVVTVSNFPNPQNVAGAVSVNNLPAVQTVTGTVAVSSIPAAPPAKRMQFVGTTIQEYIGNNVGGFWGATTKCQMRFPESRICSREEYFLTTSLPSGFFTGSWGLRVPSF